MSVTKVSSALLADDSVVAATIADNAITAAAIADNAITAAAITDGTITASKLGTGVGGAFNNFLVKTANYTAVTRDQLIVNSGSAVTITLPASPSAGNIVFIENAGAGTVTVARNGSNINSTADDGELATDAGATLVYVDSTVGWKELQMAIKLGGGGGSASQINEIVTLNNSANTVTLEDGRVYLKGGVFETNLSTYPLASVGYKYTGFNFSVNAQSTLPYAIEWDGTFFWVLHYNGPVYKYNASGVYQNSTWTTASQATNTRGLVWDGTHFWVLNFGGTVYKYNASGTYQNVSWSADAQTSDVKDMVWDGTSFWVVDGGSDAVYKYNSSGVYQNVSFSTASQATDPTGIAWDGTSFWVVDRSLKKVFKYNSSGVYQDLSFDLYSGETGCYGLTWDGTSLFSVGLTLDSVYKYSQANGVESVSNLGGQNYVRVV